MSTAEDKRLEEQDMASPEFETPIDSANDDMQEVDKLIDVACSRIAPLWPLKHFVAVNPFFGLRDQMFQTASDTMARIVGTNLYMPREYYLEQLATGRITRNDLKLAIWRSGSELDIDTVEQTLSQPAPQPKMGMVPVSDLLEQVEGGLWKSFVTERISLHCASYFDLGQSLLQMPLRHMSLYGSWLKTARIDRSPAMMGLGDFRVDIARLPQHPRDAIKWAIKELSIHENAVERYLHASLMSICGWAAWASYLKFQAELKGQEDDCIVDLLAIRLMWDVILYKEKKSAALVARWREMLTRSMRPPSAKRRASAEIDRILLNAMEIGFQRTVVTGFNKPNKSNKPAERPSLQAAFCIDVRSEVYRRSLETVSPNAQTIGFAGFFGIFIEHKPLGSSCSHSHVPVIFNSAYSIEEKVKGDVSANDDLIEKRRNRVGLAKAWKGFKLSAASCFSFVEAAGLVYIKKILSDSFGLSRPVADPKTQGLGKDVLDKIGPSIVAKDGTGIPESEWLDNAERILRAMSMTENFARIVLLAGHGSTSANNPHATALDCGACAGQTGEASARVVVAILNQPSVRKGLKERGIDVPEDTWFLAGLHDTTTDDMRLFDTDDVPDELSDDVLQLRGLLEQAADLTRLQRSALLGTESLPDNAIESDVRSRSKDWSQVRPEWALVSNAAFIVAPRERTADVDLGGRAFLHDYRWKNDDGFKILELIMTAPMVVGNWINMQYYGSMVNNELYGSGNKVLHNIVGGAIGVLEGNGGDLRTGLSMQSLHDGKKWVHEALRLSVFIEAPQEEIDNVINNHELVRQLVENRWLHLFQIDDDGTVYRRDYGKKWSRFKSTPES